MGETLALFAPEFNRAVRIEARSERISSDAGALLLREVDHRFGLTAGLAATITDPRDPESVTHPLVELLRTSLLASAQGWRDQDDVTALRHDPVFRVAVSRRRGTSPLEAQPGQPDGLASQSTLSRMVRMLSAPANRAALQDALATLAAQRLRAAGLLEQEHWLDVDSIAREVHGHQDGAEYNGHYHCTCYHPLVAVLGEVGDLVGAWLRPGRAHAAKDADERIPELVERLLARGVKLAGVRLDAGFPSGALLDTLEERDIPYVARLRANSALDRLVGEVHLLPRLNSIDGGEPETVRFVERTYKAGKWKKARRVVCVIIQDEGELFARRFYLITSYGQDERDAATLLADYRQRGTGESRFGEWMSTVPPSLASTNRTKSHYRGQEPQKRTEPRDAFACNEAQLLLSALAYGLIHVVRGLAQRATRRGWSLQRTAERLLKVAARLVRSGRRLTFVLSRSAAELHALVWAELAAIPPPA